MCMHIWIKDKAIVRGADDKVDAQIRIYIHAFWNR